MFSLKLLIFLAPPVEKPIAGLSATTMAGAGESAGAAVAGMLYCAGLPIPLEGNAFEVSYKEASVVLKLTERLLVPPWTYLYLVIAHSLSTIPCIIPVTILNLA